MKRCPVCGRELDESAFNAMRSSRDGLQRRCRECQSAYNRGNPSRYNMRVSHGGLIGAGRYVDLG